MPPEGCHRVPQLGRQPVFPRLQCVPRLYSTGWKAAFCSFTRRPWAGGRGCKGRRGGSPCSRLSHIGVPGRAEEALWLLVRIQLYSWGKISLCLNPQACPSVSAVLPHCFLHLFPLPDCERLEGRGYVIKMMVEIIVRMTIIIILY